MVGLREPSVADGQVGTRAGNEQRSASLSSVTYWGVAGVSHGMPCACGTISRMQARDAPCKGAGLVLHTCAQRLTKPYCWRAARARTRETLSDARVADAARHRAGAQDITAPYANPTGRTAVGHQAQPCAATGLLCVRRGYVKAGAANLPRADGQVAAGSMPAAACVVTSCVSA